MVGQTTAPVIPTGSPMTMCAPVAVASVVLVALVAPTSADERPAFNEQLASARKNGVGCKDIVHIPRYGRDFGPAVVRLCKQGRWKLEWIVCEWDKYGSCEKYLTRAQLAQLEKVMSSPPPPPVAESVSSGKVTVDRIVVTSGTLTDGGAGAARWAHRSAIGCLGLRPGTAKIRVTTGSTPGEDATLVVDGSADLRGCLAGRIGTLWWTDGAEGVTVSMRVITRR